jgi:hypothetical protein
MRPSTPGWKGKKRCLDGLLPRVTRACEAYPPARQSESFTTVSHVSMRCINAFAALTVFAREAEAIGPPVRPSAELATMDVTPRGDSPPVSKHFFGLLEKD